MPINNFLLPGAKFTPAYEVANSCRFDDGSSAYMHKTPGSAGDQQKFTFSFWIKRCALATGPAMTIFDTEADDDNQFKIRFNDNGTLTVESKVSDHNDSLITNDLYRDPSAWMNFVIAFDTTQGTDTNRVKIYVNGTQITAFGTSNYPAQNLNTLVNAANKLYVGTSAQTDAYCDMYVAEFCLVDGSQLAATSFGEFDEDSPRIWKPKDVSGLTFGTNGFYLDFEDSANLGNDANGGTDLTEVNLAAADQATDTPMNSFATLNPLASLPNTSKSTFSEGNCIAVAGSDASYVNGGSTIGVANGKWYVETKLSASSDGTARCIIGITMDVSEISRINQDAGSNNIFYSLHYGNFSVAGSTSGFTGLTTSAVGDIVGVALDMDNGKVYFSKNGSWLNSGDPTSGSSGTGAAPVAASTTGLRFFFSGSDSNARTMTTAYNFGGCPGFAISSGNADANGYGNFEYAVPSGYYALCTKNLAEYGG